MKQIAASTFNYLQLIGLARHQDIQLQLLAHLRAATAKLTFSLPVADCYRHSQVLPQMALLRPTQQVQEMSPKVASRIDGKLSPKAQVSVTGKPTFAGVLTFQVPSKCNRTCTRLSPYAGSAFCCVIGP